MENDSPMSTESLEQCIICLSERDEYNSISFPCIYSSCKCKYIMNLDCIKKYDILECPICKASINYKKTTESLTKDDFNQNEIKINQLTLNIPTATYLESSYLPQNEIEQYKCKCNCNKTVLCVSFPFTIIIALIVLYSLSQIDL